MTTPDPTSWVTVPIRGQLNAIGPTAEQDENGAYPLSLSLRRQDVPAVLQRLVQAAVDGAATAGTLPPAETLRMFADQLARAYDWRTLDEVEQEDPDRAQAHHEAAEALWPWLANLPREQRRERFIAGHRRGRERAREEAQRAAERDASHLPLATEFRIPCPAPDPAGHTDLLSRRQPEPLLVRKNTSGHPVGWEDGWSVTNPNLDGGEHVWTGLAWVYRGDLPRHGAYRWTRDEAITEAQRLAPLETERFAAVVAELRAGRQP